MFGRGKVSVTPGPTKLRRRVRATQVVGAASALLASTMMTGSAQARATVPGRTSLTLHVSEVTNNGSERTAFFGRLRSSRDVCEEDQLIRLVRLGTGTVALVETDDDGTFFKTLRGSRSRGDFVALFRGSREFDFDDNDRDDNDRDDNGNGNDENNGNDGNVTKDNDPGDGLLGGDLRFSRDAVATFEIRVSCRSSFSDEVSVS